MIQLIRTRIYIIIDQQPWLFCRNGNAVVTTFSRLKIVNKLHQIIHIISAMLPLKTERKKMNLHNQRRHKKIGTMSNSLNAIPDHVNSYCPISEFNLVQERTPSAFDVRGFSLHASPGGGGGYLTREVTRVCGKPLNTLYPFV